MTSDGARGVGAPGSRGVQPRGPVRGNDPPPTDQGPSEFEQLLAAEGSETAPAAGTKGTLPATGRPGPPAGRPLGAAVGEGVKAGGPTLPAATFTAAGTAATPGGATSANKLLGGPADRLAQPTGPGRATVLPGLQAPGADALLPPASGLATPPQTADASRRKPFSAVGPHADVAQAHTLSAEVNMLGQTATSTLDAAPAGLRGEPAGPRRRPQDRDELDLARLGAELGAAGTEGQPLARFVPDPSPSETRPTAPVPVPQLADQLIEAVRVQTVGDRTSVDLQLDLGRLGSANVELSRGADGEITIRFALADAPAATDVGRQAGELLQALQERGLESVRIEVASADGQVHAALGQTPGGEPATLPALAAGHAQGGDQPPTRQQQDREHDRRRQPEPPADEEELT
jgi:hypothetical protein